MWQQHSNALPVFCCNRETGVRVEGVFRVVDGRKTIVTTGGELLTPADFEREGGRGTTKNWQLSIAVTGEPCWLPKAYGVSTCEAKHCRKVDWQVSD